VPFAASSPAAAAPTPAPGRRAIGWAGLLLETPETWELSQIEGDGKKGSLNLIDASQRRLAIFWETLAGRRIDPERAIRARLGAAAGLSRWKRGRAAIERVDAPHLTPLYRLPHPLKPVDLYSGFSPATRRIISVDAPRGETPRFAHETADALISIRDQPSDQPALWAYFSHSFAAPPGLIYRAATLNLGDMRVWFSAGAKRPVGVPSVCVRFVYPSEAALSRKRLEEWHADFLQTLRFEYGLLVGGWRLGKSPQRREVQTPRGPAWLSALRQVHPLRPMRGRSPTLRRKLHLWTIHDADAARVIQIVITEEPERAAELFDDLLAGLHWARRADCPPESWRATHPT
jgi:hypothetical protein